MFPSTFKVEKNKVPLFFHFESKRTRYGHFVVFSSLILKQMVIKTRKLWYLGHFSSKWKNESTLFPATFEIEEYKVPLFFHFEAKWPRYGHFVFFSSRVLKQMMKKTSKLRYLSRLSPKWKNKSTLFPLTFKGEENKVPLFFQFEAKWLSYGHFVVFQQ